MTRVARIAPRLLAWHASAGRHDLPWQNERSAYRVWVSEIMLQQTQVSTVIPYFERFMARFPDIATLAAAPIDEVLHLWTGLGYYARARNLHLAAQRVRDEHHGEFPRALADVMELPGIGRSTAGAILAISADLRYPILDGNVKRVLSRYYTVDGTPGTAATLWQLAEDETPHENVAVYTQAIMDLGATVCTRTRPRCTECPIANDCGARRAGSQAQLPATADNGTYKFTELQGAVEGLTAVLKGLTTPPDIAEQPPIGADLAARLRAQEPQLARELRKLLQEIETAS